MLWIIAISGYLAGSLGISVALGARLRIESLEQELAYWRRLGASVPLHSWWHPQPGPRFVAF